MCTTRSSSRWGWGRYASVHAGIDPPGVGLGTPPWCWPGDPQVWDWRPPTCGPGDPLGCGPGDLPSQIPLNFPLGCGPGDPPAQIPPTSTLGVSLETPWPDPPQLPLRVWAWKPARHARIWPAMHAGIPPDLLWTEFLAHAFANITLPQTSFAGGKNVMLNCRLICECAKRKSLPILASLTMSVV